MPAKKQTAIKQSKITAPKKSTNINRCGWAKGELYEEYHDTEWGRPVHDDQVHFEFLILEGAQAGLSWITVLKKRDAYRKAFANFDAKKVAKYTDAQLEKLMLDEGIIRNRLKIWAARSNAIAFLATQKEFGTFNKYIWQFVQNKTIDNPHKSLKDIPPRSKESDALSKDLKKRGFKFVGSTIIYAHMQACGLINDHLQDCFCRKKKRVQKA